MNTSHQQLRGSQKRWAIVACAVGIVLLLCALAFVGTSPFWRGNESKQTDIGPLQDLTAPVEDADSLCLVPTQDGFGYFVRGPDGRPLPDNPRHLKASPTQPHRIVEPFNIIKKSAEKGDARAQVKIGRIYEKGQGVPEDKTEAAKWYRRAAEQNEASAQFQLGLCYYYGEGVAKDEVEAAKWYRRSAEQNSATAQFLLGCLLGLSVAADDTEAVKWFRRAAEQNLAPAQYVLAGYYFNGETVVNHDEGEAMRWLRKAAEQNYAPAESALANRYLSGQGVLKNEAEAAKWFRKAADQEEVHGQFGLGYCYYNGQGVAQDYTEALRWFHKAAADQGWECWNAQYALGVCYLEGQGVAQDEVEAVKWFLKAAEWSQATKAQFMLGVCYQDGRGVAQDEAEAVKWYRKAAKNGHQKAQEFIAAAEARAVSGEATTSKTVSTVISQVRATQGQIDRAEERIRYWGFESDYMKFSAGTVVSIRRFALIKEGVYFPRIYPKTFILRAFSRYKVMDSDDLGCRIEPVDSDKEYFHTNEGLDVFVNGLNGYSGRIYGPILLRDMEESYSYTTVRGTQRVVPRCEKGARATKQEWDEYLNNN